MKRRRRKRIDKMKRHEPCPSKEIASDENSSTR